MDCVKLCEFSDEILKKKFYDCMLNFFLFDNILKLFGVFLNGYFVEILMINIMNLKYFCLLLVYYSLYCKSYKYFKDYVLYYF